MLAQSFSDFIHQLNIDALLGLDGKLLCCQGIDIADYEASTHSLMPEGLEILMPVDDFRNLVAFLSSLK
jgi:hypothetical protein